MSAQTSLYPEHANSSQSPIEPVLDARGASSAVTYPQGRAGAEAAAEQVWKKKETPGHSKTRIAVIAGGAILVVALAVGAILSTSGGGAVQEEAVLTGLSAQADAIDGLIGRQLTDKVYLRKLFVQPGDIVRYQIIDAELSKDGLQLRRSFDDRREMTIAVVTGDEIGAPVLRQAAAIYVDVYDIREKFLYTYNFNPVEIF